MITKRALTSALAVLFAAGPALAFKPVPEMANSGGNAGDAMPEGQIGKPGDNSATNTGKPGATTASPTGKPGGTTASPTAKPAPSAVAEPSTRGRRRSPETTKPVTGPRGNQSSEHAPKPEIGVGSELKKTKFTSTPPHKLEILV